MDGTASFADRQMVSLATNELEMKLSSRALLKGLLRYGLRNNCDLGLGRNAFRAACATHGIVL